MATSNSPILDNLNEAQRAAVTHIEGPLLTLAGPGSGKTRVVTHRIAYMLEQGVSPYSILALTFTNKAAQEMKSRVARLSQDAPVWMGTFHGYCARFLRRYGRMVGLSENFSIFDMDDAAKVLKQSVEWSGVAMTHLSMNDIAKGIGELKNRVITPEMLEGEGLSSSQKVLSKIYPVYQKLLLQCNAVDFDDMLMHTASILRSSPDLRSELDGKHRFILVDEYQDTNLAQYLIVRSLSMNHPNLNVTGDPDQSIYGWRGADISNILNFEKDFPNVVTIRLEENYRSTPQVLSIADSLIACNTRRKAKKLVPTRPNGESVRLCTYATARDEASDIAEQIALAVLDGAKPKDFAVLYRTNAHSRLLEAALRKRNLNYQLIGGFRFYHREEIKDLLAYLRLINNPTDDVSFERIINVPTRGLGDKSIAKVAELARSKEIPMLVALRAIIEHGMLSTKASKGAREFLELYEDLVRIADGPVSELISMLVKRTDYIRYLSNKKSETPDESIEGNIDELITDAAEFDLEYQEGNAVERFLEQVTLLSDADGISDSDQKVTLMTLHSAKGLEFDTVFIIAVEQEVLPHIRSMYDPSKIEEERRLFFVGITRAKNRLQLSMAAKRGNNGSRMSCGSPFLMELPRAEMEIVDKTLSFDAHEEYSDEQSYFQQEWQDASFLHRPSKRRNNKTKLSGIVRASEWQSAFTESETSAFPTDQLDDDIDHDSKTSLESINLQFPKSALKPAAQVTGAMTPDGIPVDRFEEGDLVTHPTYGRGTIESVEGRGIRRIARVAFDDGLSRSFQLSKSRLTYP